MEHPLLLPSRAIHEDLRTWSQTQSSQRCTSDKIDGILIRHQIRKCPWFSSPFIRQVYLNVFVRIFSAYVTEISQCVVLAGRCVQVHQLLYSWFSKKDQKEDKICHVETRSVVCNFVVRMWRRPNIHKQTMSDFGMPCLQVSG